MEKRNDHGCHAGYDVKGYVSIDNAAEIIGISQDKARDVLKRFCCKTQNVKTGERGRDLTVFFKRDVERIASVRKNKKRVHVPGPVLYALATPTKQSKVYDLTYDDFFQWSYDTDRNCPKLFFEEYVRLYNMFESSNSEIVKTSIGHAMRECWVEHFNKVMHYLLHIVGTPKPNGGATCRERNVRRLEEALASAQKGGNK